MAKSGKKKSGETTESKESSVKLFELTALKNIDSKESKDKTAIWIKNWHLAYEIELRRLQVELMKLQKAMKARGTRIPGFLGLAKPSGRQKQSKLAIPVPN